MLALALRLRRCGWEVARFLPILKSRGFVRPIAKGLAGGVAATAKRKDLAGQFEFVPIGVDDFHRTPNAIWPVETDDNLSFRHGTFLLDAV